MSDKQYVTVKTTTINRLFEYHYRTKIHPVCIAHGLATYRRLVG